MKPSHFLLFALVMALIFQPRAFGFVGDYHQPYVAVVSNTRDSGYGSLRAAIASANHNATTRIAFQIPITDGGFEATQRDWRIVPLSPLPALRKPDTQLDAGGKVLISGTRADAGGVGLRVEAIRCRIRGLKWQEWPQVAISIHSSQTLVEKNEFRDSPVGIEVAEQKSRRNRFDHNTFEGVKTPLVLQDGSNDGIAAPVLTIVRDDAVAPVSHHFTLRFTGKARANVTFELAYSSGEARGEPQIQSVRDTLTMKSDGQGNAVWQFDWKGYPAGSWTATATQNGSTSAFSNTVVMPYL